MKNKIAITIFILLTKIMISQSINAVYLYTNLSSKESYIIDLHIENEKSLSVFHAFNSLNDTVFVDNYDIINFKLEGKDSIGRQYFINGEKRTIVFRDFIYINSIFKPVIVEEPIPNYNWYFKNKKKQIGDFKCDLVHLKFRGREYNIWYTTEIPTPFGPWKFYGLPGLIIKITSFDNTIHFQLKKITKSENHKITEPKDGDKISFDDYVNYKHKTIDEFIKKLQSKLPRGSKITVNNTNDTNLEKSFEK
jgi:GLPGLI family protein